MKVQPDRSVGDANNNSDDDDAVEPPKKKTRFLGVGLDSDDDEEDRTFNAVNEIQRYEAEPKVNSSCDPFVYWKSKSDVYPLMSEMSKKYLAIQASVASNTIHILLNGVSLIKIVFKRNSPKYE